MSDLLVKYADDVKYKGNEPFLKYNSEKFNIAVKKIPLDIVITEKIASDILSGKSIEAICIDEAKKKEEIVEKNPVVIH